MTTEFHVDSDIPEKGYVFVFGSNLSGIHNIGKAKIASDRFNAERGVGIGLTGQAYAIPTLNRNLHSLPLSIIKKYIIDFCKYTHNNSDIMKFFVTRIGASDKDIAPLFKDAKNCSFPLEWRRFLN